MMGLIETHLCIWLIFSNREAIWRRGSSKLSSSRVLANLPYSISIHMSPNSAINQQLTPIIAITACKSCQFTYSTKVEKTDRIVAESMEPAFWEVWISCEELVLLQEKGNGGEEKWPSRFLCGGFRRYLLDDEFTTWDWAHEGFRPD